MLRDIAGALGAVIRASLKRPILPLGVLFGFGILIPYRNGFDFLDIRLIMAYAFIPMLFVAPGVTGALQHGSEARSSARKLYAWVCATALYGWMAGMLLIIAALITVKSVYHPAMEAGAVLPAQGALPVYAGFSFACVWFIASSSAFIALLFSPEAARSWLRGGFLLLLIFLYLGPGYMPSSWQSALGEVFTSEGFPRAAWTVTAVVALAAIGLLSSLRAAFDRAPKPGYTAGKGLDLSLPK